MTNPDKEKYSQEHRDVKKQLQKSFTVLKQCVKVWQDARTECATSIKSITNLTEQYQSCMNVQMHDLPYSEQHPDIKDKLLHKIGLEIDKHFEVLRKFVGEMKECCEKMNKQSELCMAHYNRTCGVQDLTSVTIATACYPSVIDMLEWIEISDRQLQNNFYCKEHLLVSYSPELEGTMDTWHKYWDDTNCLNKIEGYIASTQFFLEVDFT